MDITREQAIKYILDIHHKYRGNKFSSFFEIEESLKALGVTEQETIEYLKTSIVEKLNKWKQDIDDVNSEEGDKK
jgi:hypothetical protein